MKKMIFMLSSFALLLCGCVTHYVVDDTCRLQIGNDTQNYTVTSFSVVSKDNEIVWISDDVEPGEKSKVSERDFVGSFTVRLKMSGSSKVDTTFKQRFDGGSVFLQIVEDDGAIEIHRR